MNWKGVRIGVTRTIIGLGLACGAAAQVTTRVSVSSASIQGNGLSNGPSISADGQFIAFYSDATNLVPGDTNAARDVFLRDTVAGTTIRVSVDSNGVQANGKCEACVISSDGRYIVYASDATNLVPGDT